MSFTESLPTDLSAPANPSTSEEAIQPDLTTTATTDPIPELSNTLGQHEEPSATLKGNPIEASDASAPTEGSDNLTNDVAAFVNEEGTQPPKVEERKKKFFVVWDILK